MNSYLIPIVGFLAAASASSAATVSLLPVTFNSATGSVSNYPTLNFAKFDSSLGTLTGVSFSFTVDSIVTSATVTNTNTGSVTIDKFSFTRDFTITDSAGDELFNDLAAKNKTFTSIALLNGQSKTVTSVSFNQVTGTALVDSGLAAFTGTGSTFLTLNNTIGVTPNVTAGGSQSLSWATTVSGGSSGSVAVTYTYDEAPSVSAVPEPSSVIFSGLLLGSGLLVRRRKVRG